MLWLPMPLPMSTPMRVRYSYAAAVAVLCALLASCGSNTVRDGPPAGGVSIPELPGDAVPRPEGRSRYGNGPVYEVLGKRYTVMPSGDGYRERGVASWYGNKFHGRLTSSREPYDMYAMTAAHKTLPLPTYVRVRNLRNDRSVVVRVNDRGPFVHNRIIDLSYAAALRLDMIDDGTSLVEVTAITFGDPTGDRPVSKPVPVPAERAAVTDPAPPDEPASTAGPAHEIYVQVGAFGDRSNAERRQALLLSGGIGDAFIYADEGGGAALYRVRIGPIAGVDEYDILVDKLAALGINDPWLVSL